MHSEVVGKKENKLEKILNKSYRTKKELIEIGGVTLPLLYKTYENDIANFEVYDQDVWICGFPKSGTNWTQEMIWLIMNDLDFDVAKKIRLEERSPYFEREILPGMKKIIDMMKEHKILEPKFKYKILKETRTRPHCLKSHLPFNLLPKQIQNGTKKPKILCIIRNPKDVCVSFFHHDKLFCGYVGSFEDYCELFLAGKLWYSPYWNNVLTYWKQRHRSNILFLKYEDMKTDLKSVLRQVSAFLEKSLNEEQISILAEHLSFESMKNNPSVNGKAFSDFFKEAELTGYEAGEFMRSGSVGDHKTHLSPDTIDRFNEWINLMAKNTDFDVYADKF